MQSGKSRFTTNLFNNWAVVAIALALAIGPFTGSAQALLKPTVTFTGAPVVATNGTTFTVTATTNDGTTATITATGPCSVSGTTVTMTNNTGSCSLKAAWPATKTYTAAMATQKTTAATGYTESDIYYFYNNYEANGNDGLNPNFNGLVFDKSGNLYASTVSDANNGNGAIVELSPTAGGGWNEKLLYVFDRYSESFSGWSPQGSLAIDSKGNLYGTTQYGGGIYNSGTGEYPCGGSFGCGTVFELSPTEQGLWIATDIYDFGVNNANDGTQPEAGVTLATTAATTLYGTTQCGGTSNATLAGCGKGLGTIYQLVYTKATKTKPASWTETVLYNFPGTGTSTGSGAKNDTNGFYPESSLFLKSGNLYGTTRYGGITANSEDGIGVLFELSPGAGGWTFNQLYVFCTNQSQPGSCADGATPGHGTVYMDSKDNLYGTATSTLVNQPGTVWELPYSSTTKSYASQVDVLYSTSGSSSGASVGDWVVPYKTSFFTLGQSGATSTCCTELIDLTYSAKTGWGATAGYQFPPSGAESGLNTLYGVANQMIVDKNGNFYSLAGRGGPYNGSEQAPEGYGGVFEISPMP